MYHMTSSSDILAEVPFYLGVALCGVLGYMFVKRTKEFYPQQVQFKAGKLSLEEDEKPKSRKGKSRKQVRGTQQEAAECDQSNAGQAEVVAEEAVVHPPPTSSGAPQAAEASADDSVAASPTLIGEENVKQVEEAVPQMSDKVLRLMAKKAERKARKAQQQQEQQLIQAKAPEAAQALTTISEEAAEATPASIHTDALAVSGEQTKEQETHDVEVNAHVVPTSPVQEEIPSSPASEDGAKEPICRELSVAELSTGDEGLMQSGESAEESLEEELEGSSHDEASKGEEDLELRDMSWFEESEALPVPELTIEPGMPEESFGSCPAPEETVFWTYAVEPLAGYAGAPFDDAWMTPFEEIIRSRSQAEQVYEQVYNMMKEAEAAQAVQYKPVLCGDNQQFYTDGQQLFMLACIDPAKGGDENEPVSMRPVVDPQDPLHAEFTKDSLVGLEPLPVSEEQCDVHVSW